MAAAPTLKMGAEIAQKIRDHGAQSYPHECCGALLGHDTDESNAATAGGGLSLQVRVILALFPLVNRREDSPHNRFSVTAEDVRDAEKAAREKGLDVAGTIRIRIIQLDPASMTANTHGRGTATSL